MQELRYNRDRRFSPRANDPSPSVKVMMDRIVDLTQEKTRMANDLEAMRRDVMSLRRDKSSLLTNLRRSSRDRRGMAAVSATSQADKEQTGRLVEDISNALQAEIRDLENELSRRPAETCVACMERPREIAYIPCGHFVVCTACANKWESCCPVCKARATSTVKIFNA